MTRMKARSLVVAAVFVAVVLPANDAEAGDLPTWSDLPTGTAGDLDALLAAKGRLKPASVGARERVPHLDVLPRRLTYEQDSPRYATVAADATVGDGMLRGDVFEYESNRDACLMEATQRFDVHEQEGQGGDGPRDSVDLWPRSRENAAGGVTAIHAERIVETKGAFSLESTDAWVDPSTRGARLIGRSSVPLRLIRTVIGGVRVFGTRDRTNAGELMQFVVARDGNDRGLGGMTATRHAAGGASKSQCGHLRVTLSAKDGGESATVVASMTLAIQQSPRAAWREARIRDVAVHLSVSKTSRDKEPVVAVSFGWASRERRQRVFETYQMGL